MTEVEKNSRLGTRKCRWGQSRAAMWFCSLSRCPFLSSPSALGDSHPLSILPASPFCTSTLTRGFCPSWLHSVNLQYNNMYNQGSRYLCCSSGTFKNANRKLLTGSHPAALISKVHPGFGKARDCCISPCTPKHVRTTGYFQSWACCLELCPVRWVSSPDCQGPWRRVSCCSVPFPAQVPLLLKWSAQFAQHPKIQRRAFWRVSVQLVWQIGASQEDTQHHVQQQQDLSFSVQKEPHLMY